VYFETVLQSAKFHKRPEKRIEMIYILGRLRDERVLDTLDEFLAESDPYVVYESVGAIAEIGGPEALKLLLSIRDHRSLMVRKRVAQALEEWDQKKSAFRKNI